MLKVTIYIEKEDFDTFFQWINRLNHGILTTNTIKYSTQPEGFTSPLQLSLEPGMYHLMTDAETDLHSLKELYGDIDINFDPMSQSWEMRAIKDILRNARRYDLESEVAYTALITMMEVPSLTPSEAMIIAEREWITRKNDKQDI